MVLYGLKNCDTCRKALNSFESFQFLDVRADGVPQDVLKRAIAQFPDQILNTRSTTWRGLDEAERVKAPLELLELYPTLMKRPLIEHEGTLYLGWGKDVQNSLLGAS